MHGVRGQLSNVVHTEIKVGGEGTEVGGHGRQPQVGAVGAEQHALLLAAARRRTAPRALPAAQRPPPQPGQAEQEKEEEECAVSAGRRHGSRETRGFGLVVRDFVL